MIDYKRGGGNYRTLTSNEGGLQEILQSLRRGEGGRGESDKFRCPRQPKSLRIIEYFLQTIITTKIASKNLEAQRTTKSLMVVSSFQFS